jgi:hypothetical protein
MNKLFATLFFGFFAVSVNAVAADAAPKTDDAKHQEMFSKMKQLRIDGIQGRISVLQTALSCVNAATSHEQMKPCQEQEQKAMEDLREKQKAAMEAMRPAGGRK